MLYATQLLEGGQNENVLDRTAELFPPSNNPYIF